ncbi:MAG: T9SS type A sorting domain-containing protein [Bacteroidia bacterium]|nr:T9SS type A sorting domain-containing protein [Bacteroidia bacterium]
MKKILLLLLCIASGYGLYAQTSGGPDAYGYIWRDSNDPNGPAYNWVDIANDPSAIEVTGLSDDNIVGPFFLPNPFQYYWYTVDRFWIGSNGYIVFSPNTSFAHPFPVIPTPDNKNNYVAPLMTDLNLDQTGTASGNPASCYYWYSPNEDSVIVTWDSVPFWNTGSPSYIGENTFQIILNYNDSSITFQYLTQNGASVSTLDFTTTGIENTSGNDGLMWAHDQYAPSQYAIKFYPPVSSTLQINDASTNYNDNPLTGAKFLSKNATGTFYLTAEVKNSGNTTLNPFNVTGVVRAQNNAIVVSNTAVTDTLQAGQTQLLSYANAFIPVNAGTFRFINTTTLAGDAASSNDVKTMELQVVDTTLLDIELKYDNGTAAAGGISWNGGDGGCANYFIPPFYPCDITKVAAYIVADPNAVGYTMKVFDDDGPAGSAGTMLDSIYVAPGTFTLAAFNTSILTQAIRVDSGGFYVVWQMNGDGVSLGQNQIAPFSNRTFEVLSGTMSDYRYRDIEDLMIRANISRVGVGLAESEKLEGIGQFFPNPARDRAALLVDASALGANLLYVQLYDIKGALVSSDRLAVQNGQIEVDLSGLESGLYTVRFSTGSKEISRKLNVIR